jgi:hypothetical protein
MLLGGAAVGNIGGGKKKDGVGGRTNDGDSYGSGNIS